MLDQQVTMTTGTLLSLLRRRQAEPHTVLGEAPVWHSEETSRAQDQRANAELATIGLSGRNGIHPGLLATVDAIGRPALEYYAWIGGGHDGRPLNCTLLAGSGAGEAFVLVRNTDNNVVVVATVRPDELLAGFITQIPRLAPAKGEQLVVPKGDLAGDDGDPSRDDFGVMRSNRQSAGSRAAAELARVLELPRMGGGSLYVAARTRAGTRHRVDKPVNYIDTGEGRWLTEEVPGAGDSMLTCTPATPQIIEDRLRKAQGTLRT